MRRIILSSVAVCAIILTTSTSPRAQSLLNGSFESRSDSSATIPRHWTFELASGIHAIRDTTVAHTGNSSFRVTVSDSNNFVFLLTQVCDVTVSAPRRIRISLYLKTLNCPAGAGLLCSQKNEKDERLDYTSSRQQSALIKGSNDWTKAEIIVLLRSGIAKIEVSPMLYSSGTAWFDDVVIEPINEGVKTAPKVAAYLDTLIKDVKENSLWKDSIDWKILTAQLRSLAAGMQTYREADLLSNYMINELRQHGDHHSLFMVPFAAKEMSTSDIQGRGRVVETSYLGNGIGYISMPGFATLNDSLGDAFATDAQAKIRKVDTANTICGWVVDLRGDDGGSCPPMIAGLGPILGNTITSFDKSPEGVITLTGYENGATYAVDKGKVATDWRTKAAPWWKLRNENVPVAVLIGPGCGSSGEGAAGAFIGRRDTKLFGQPTGGYTKGNEDFTLPDSSMIFISSGIMTDRNGKKYPERIFPDVQIDQQADSKDDLVLEGAKKWLGNVGRCK